jgi:peptidoglycan/LPS O-acetylase OafA/YrhL
VALTVLAIFPGVAGVYSGEWWRYYGFLQLYDERSLGRGIPVAWTLCVEVSFYLALPFWAAAARRLRPRAELALLGLLAVGGLVVQVEAARLAISHPVGPSLAGQCTWFALGMALAVVSVAAPRRDVPAVACWGAAAAAFAGLVALRLHSGGVLGLIVALRTPQPLARTAGGLALIGAIIVLLMLPAVFGQDRGGWPRRLLAWPPLVRLGLVSYGVYLWHLTIAELIALPASPGQFTAHGLGWVDSLPVPTLSLLVLVLAASWAVAEASYRAVELPFLRRKER